MKLMWRVATLKNGLQDATAYRLDRFATGYLVDEAGTGADVTLH